MPRLNGAHANGNHATEDGSLEILIIGAGIGGLTAALALRQQGHNVTLFESSGFSNETGAAIHVAPNSNGLLRRMGLKLEDIGGNEMCELAQYEGRSGRRLSTMDLKEANSIWQHPWHLVHRVHLHAALRERAVGNSGKGNPATLRLSSRVVLVNPEQAQVTLENGEVVSGDLVLGADGVHSICRSFLPDGARYKPYDCGYSAYRFIVPKEEVMKDTQCSEFVKNDGLLCMIMDDDRRVVVYPCADNTLLNFLLIHPSHESRMVGSDKGWNQVGNKQRMLEVGSTFAPQVQALLKKAPEDSLKVWTLLDMDVLPTWISGSMALLGDAAHPFLPHQAQGGGQAMEDAVSLAALIPLGTRREQVPERLQLYQKCRKDRADRIQEATRRSGKTRAELEKLGVKYDPMAFTNYNFCHDEWDFSTNALKKHIVSQGIYRFRQPLSFGPAPSPRQPQNSLPDVLSFAKQNQTVASIRFKTSRTFLQNLLPTDQFSFTSPGTVAQASFICCSLRNMAWLGDTGYNHCGLYIHGVQYTKRNGETLKGTFMPILFEDLMDPIITGREEIAAPKMGCKIDISTSEDSRSVKLSWRGTTLVELDFEGLKDEERVKQEQNGHAVPVTPKPEPDDGMLLYRYIPAVGDPGKADAEYAVFEEFPKPAQPVTTGDAGEGQSSKFSQTDARSSLVAKSAKISCTPGDWNSLPTLHNIAEGLSQVPVYEILEATVKEVPSVGDVRGAKRIE